MKYLSFYKTLVSSPLRFSCSFYQLTHISDSFIYYLLISWHFLQISVSWSLCHLEHQFFCLTNWHCQCHLSPQGEHCHHLYQQGIWRLLSHSQVNEVSGIFWPSFCHATWWFSKSKKVVLFIHSTHNLHKIFYQFKPKSSYLCWDINL